MYTGATKLSFKGPEYDEFAYPGSSKIHPGSISYHGITKRYGSLYRNGEIINDWFDDEETLVQDFCDWLTTR